MRKLECHHIFNWHSRVAVRTSTHFKVFVHISANVLPLPVLMMRAFHCITTSTLQKNEKKSNDIGDDQQRELHAKSNGAWKTKRNESKGEERKSQKVFGVLKIWRWTRETAMNVLWCMQKIPRIMLCVRVFVSRAFRKEAPRNSIFLWMYKWVLSSWLNQWTKRSFGKTLKSLSDQPMHTHSRTLMPRTSSLSTVVRCDFFIPF